MDLSTGNLQAQLQISFLDIWKWLWHLQTEFRKSKLLYGDLEWTSHQLTSKLNFKNSFLDIWKWLQHLQTEFRKSKLIYGDLGMDTGNGPLDLNS